MHTATQPNIALASVPRHAKASRTYLNPAEHHHGVGSQALLFWVGFKGEDATDQMGRRVARRGCGFVKAAGEGGLNKRERRRQLFVLPFSRALRLPFGLPFIQGLRLPLSCTLPCAYSLGESLAPSLQALPIPYHSYPLLSCKTQQKYRCRVFHFSNAGTLLGRLSIWIECRTLEYRINAE